MDHLQWNISTKILDLSLSCFDESLNTAHIFSYEHNVFMYLCMQEALNRKHLQTHQSLDEKDKKIQKLEDSVQKMSKERERMSVITSETQKELKATKQLLTSYQQKLQKLREVINHTVHVTKF